VHDLEDFSTQTAQPSRGTYDLDPAAITFDAPHIHTLTERLHCLLAGGPETRSALSGRIDDMRNLIV
jgi:hypothetical protein